MGAISTGGISAVGLGAGGFEGGSLGSAGSMGRGGLGLAEGGSGMGVPSISIGVDGSMSSLAAPVGENAFAKSFTSGSVFSELVVDSSQISLDTATPPGESPFGEQMATVWSLDTAKASPFTSEPSSEGISPFAKPVEIFSLGSVKSPEATSPAGIEGAHPDTSSEMFADVHAFLNPTQEPHAELTKIPAETTESVAVNEIVSVAIPAPEAAFSPKSKEEEEQEPSIHIGPSSQQEIAANSELATRILGLIDEIEQDATAEDAVALQQIGKAVTTVVEESNATAAVQMVTVTEKEVPEEVTAAVQQVAPVIEEEKKKSEGEEVREEEIVFIREEPVNMRRERKLHEAFEDALVQIIDNSEEQVTISNVQTIEVPGEAVVANVGDMNKDAAFQSGLVRGKSRDDLTIDVIEERASKEVFTLESADDQIAGLIEENTAVDADHPDHKAKAKEGEVQKVFFGDKTVHII